MNRDLDSLIMNGLNKFKKIYYSKAINSLKEHDGI